MRFHFSARRIALSLSLIGLSTAFVSPLFAQDTTTSIPKIQGMAATSSLEGQAVTIEGIVTGDFQNKEQLSGFYLQDAHGDGNTATSDGIFVYVNAKSPAAGVDVKVGDRVRVVGNVEEFHGQTQIGRTSAVQVLGQTQVPTPIAVNFPLAQGTTLENYEGMLVTFPQTLTVSNQYELAKYGTLGLSLGRLMVPTNTTPLAQVKDDSDLRSVLLDDGSGRQNPQPTPYLDAAGSRRTGSTVTGVTGILSFDFDHYRLQPTVAPTFVEANPRPFAPPAVGGTLKVAAANVLNYWTTFKDKDNSSRGAENAVSFARQSAKIVSELKALDADVVGLMELESNGSTSIDDLLGKLNAAYGAPTYTKVEDPATGLGTDRIKVGLFYKTASVTPRGASLSDADPIYERYPLAQTFVSKQNGAVFTVVVNHFKSKGISKNATTDDTDKGEGAWNMKRVQQATHLNSFIKNLQQSSSDPDVLAIGDFNSYAEEAPLLTLRGSGLKQLSLRLDPQERYSFVFGGRSGSLDHAFATPSLEGQVTGFAEWHINADEPEFLGYEDLPAEGFVATPFRASDHDPLLVGLNLTP